MTAGKGIPRKRGERRNHMSAVRRHPLITFFVLAYALSWWPLPFGSFLALGPLVAALIVLAITEGWAGLQDLGSRMIRWRVGWIWYAVAIGLPLGVHLLTKRKSYGHRVPDPPHAPADHPASQLAQPRPALGDGDHDEGGEQRSGREEG